MKKMGPSGGGSNPSSPVVVPERNYCLRLNDFEKKYAESFRSLREDDSFTDVTLVSGCPDESASSSISFKAHRVILSACSSYFHNLLVKSLSPWHSHPVLLLPDVRSRDLQALLDFIYLGQVNINNEALSSFLAVAQRLRIKGLCETNFLIPKKDIYSPPNTGGKRTKYMASPSILRPSNAQPLLKNNILIAAGTSSATQSSPPEEVPSSAVTEFITSNDPGDFSLPSHPFMISTTDPPASVVTIEEKMKSETPDLTPSSQLEVVSSPPNKKDRNARKTCGYCHKNFHEMSLKRHIKDVHFKNENTYVICPQCCKQYASQNSLYSHLNRVHGVKKESMEGLQVMMERRTLTVPVSEDVPGANAANEENIMDMTHQSDSSNG